jgi:tetratricopeptide (TPR) repeat protein
MTDQVDRLKVIAEARVPGTNIFFLGCFESRLTVLSQQRRALNLVDALIASEEIVRPNGRVAIVGGGISGMTAAAAFAVAARELQSIDLFEQTDRLLHLQTNSDRYLHPHLYDWPAPGAMRSNADLPILNWSAEEAGVVAARILSQFDLIQKQSRNLVVKTKRFVKAITPLGIGCDVAVKNAPADGGLYDAVIIAIGFGYEKEIRGENQSYWAPSRLTGPLQSYPQPVILVSGNGDGGLVDFAMAAFNRMTHNDITEFLTLYKGIEDTQQALLKIEERAWSDEEESIDILAEYNSLPIPARLLLDVYDKLRHDTTIWLHTPRQQLFRRETAILNRFTAFLAIKADQERRDKIHVCVGGRIKGSVRATKIKIDDISITPLHRILRFGANTEANLRPFLALSQQHKGAHFEKIVGFRPATPHLHESALERFSFMGAAIVTEIAAVENSLPSPITSSQTEKHILSNLPDRNLLFTGRRRELEQLQKVLASQGRAAISGLGGVGKTQTAVEYAHWRLNEYSYIFWIVADSREALVSGYVKIANLLKLPEAGAGDQEAAAEAAKRWLTSFGEWLLILDNADDLAIAREFIPTGNNGHVLLTTRARATGAVARSVEIQKMGTEEGALLLLRGAKHIAEDALIEAANPADRRDAEAIATQLGGLPLALDQAGAYIKETGCGLSGYLDLYRSHALEFLQRRGALASDHPEPVATTWALSFENMEKANPAAAELLCFCAFLYPDGISEELLREGAKELGPVLGPAVSSVLTLEGALFEIQRYSLLRRDLDAGTLEIHRLVQAVLKQTLDEPTQRTWAERAVRTINRSFPKAEFSTWQLCEQLLPQAQECVELIDRWDFEFSEGARLLNNAGFYLYQRGRYADAEAFLGRALRIREKTIVENHPDLAISLSSLARLYRVLGRYSEAEPLYMRALKIQKDLIPEQPNLATSLYGLGKLYAKQGRYREAEPLYQQAWNIREKTLKPEHPDLADSLYALAELDEIQGRYSKSEHLYLRALNIREKVLGARHPDVARSLNSLAGLYRTKSQYAKAEPLYQRALTIRETALGSEHPDVARSLNSLTDLYRDQGEYAKAEPLCQRALAILEKALGQEHPDVAISLDGLAGLYRTRGDYAKAELLYQRGMVIREKALGPGHLEVASSLDNLGALYRIQGQYAKAESLCQRALMIREKAALGPEHPVVARSLNSLADLYRDQGQYAKAKPLYERALIIFEKALGLEHPDVAWSLNSLAGLYRTQGPYVKAEPLYQRALAIREKAFGPGHLDVAWSLDSLGALYRVEGRYAKAHLLFRRALMIREKVLGAEHPDLAWSLNSLAGLYDIQGHYAKAEPLYQRAVAIREKALGPDHPDVAQSLHNLAGLYRAQGHYTKAEPLYQRAIMIREKTLGREHPDLAASLNKLAGLYRTLGRYGEAELLFQQAVTIRKKALGPEHPDVAWSLNSLAGLYDTQGQYGRAEPLYLEAKSIRENALGADHSDLAWSLNSLAGLYCTQGQYEKAEPLFQQAMAIREKALGPEHPDLAWSLDSLGALYQGQGQYEKADNFFERALAIREHALGPEHSDLAWSLNSLAGLYQTQKQYGKAEPLYERAIVIRTRALGLDHPDLAWSLNGLGVLYQSQGQYGKAGPLLQRALTIRENAFGRGHPVMATSLENYAFLLRNVGRSEEAEALEIRARAIVTKSVRITNLDDEPGR